jgi:hypothetical protein
MTMRYVKNMGENLMNNIIRITIMAAAPNAKKMLGNAKILLKAYKSPASGIEI